MPKILIGCKLPSGVTLRGSRGQNITLNGMNTSLIAGGYGITRVDADEWTHIEMTYHDFDPILTKAIFTHSGDKVADIAALGVELVGEKTGFEGMDPEAPARLLEAEKGQTMPSQESPTRTLKPASKEDKAAARELAGILGDR